MNHAKILSPRLLGLILCILCFGAAFLMKGILGSTASLPQGERRIEDGIPKHIPIKVKVKSDKERAFKDLKNEKWHRDFELEVENTGNRPIYFLELWVVLPEIISEGGHEVGFPIRYGRSEFIHFDTPIIPEDVPIGPGEIRSFTIPENYRKGWEAHKAREGRPNPTRVQIKFVQLNFGDGTGFDGTDAKPYPYKRDQSSTGPCRDAPNQENSDKAKSLRNFA